MSKKGTEIEPIMIQPGDIVFEVSMKDDVWPVHCWILTDQKPEIAHSVSKGSKVHGLARHDFTRYVATNSMTVMLRPQNVKFKTLIIQVAGNLALVLNPIQLQALINLKLQPDNPQGINPFKEIKVPFTPYSMMREKDGGTANAELNTFRAVRTALRTGIAGGRKTSLSKIRGVSCDEFAGYTIQAALVILLLGDKLNELQSLVDKISETRRQKNSSGQKNPATDLLKEFYQAFRKLAKAQNQLPTDLKETEVFNAIAFPVKGNTIQKSMPFWFGLSLFKKTEGLFADQDPRQIIPQSLMKLAEDSKKLLGFKDGDQASEGEHSDQEWGSDRSDSNQGGDEEEEDKEGSDSDDLGQLRTFYPNLNLNQDLVENIQPPNFTQTQADDKTQRSVAGFSFATNMSLFKNNYPTKTQDDMALLRKEKGAKALGRSKSFSSGSS